MGQKNKNLIEELKPLLLEEEHKQNLNAEKIQSIVRQYKARKLEKNKAVVNLQKLFRGLKGREKPNALKKELEAKMEASVKIQSLARFKLKSMY